MSRTSGKSLSPEQNERARKWLGDFLKKHEGNQSAAARALRLQPASVSRYLSGTMGTSVHVVQELARLMGRDPDEVLDPRRAHVKRARVVVEDPRYPSSYAAQQAAMLLDCTEADIFGVIQAHGTDDDPGDGYWITEFIRARDVRRRHEKAQQQSAPESGVTRLVVAPPSSRRVR